MNGTKALIEELVADLINKFQVYFEKKWVDRARVAELEKQLEENKKKLEQLKAKGKQCTETYDNNSDCHSEITMYRNVVEKEKDKSRISSSSEEMTDTSDESLIIDNLTIAEKELRKQLKDEASNGEPKTRKVVDNTSSIAVVKERDMGSRKDEATSHTESMVLEAEEARARVYDVKGKEPLSQTINDRLGELRANVEERWLSTDKVAPQVSVYIDEDYMLVTSHVDLVTRQKIINQEFMDFNKLLRKEKSEEENQQKMMMVNKGGVSYWVPLTDKNMINGYGKWDQAFRVYLDIYSSKFPERISELIQYWHIIQTASFTYAWENVAQYDREFCRHMEQHPNRSWGVILQQVWTMFLKDRIGHHQYQSNTGKFAGGGSSSHTLHQMVNQTRECVSASMKAFANMEAGASLTIDVAFVANMVMDRTIVVKLRQ